MKTRKLIITILGIATTIAFCLNIAVGFAMFFLFLGLLAWASYSIEHSLYCDAICDLGTNEKIIALSFDDGPDAEHTNEVLDVLKQYDIKANFFLIGEKVKQHPAIVLRIKQEGHQIGNHSFFHKSGFPMQGFDAIFAELEQCNVAIQEATGDMCTLFRPPFGVTNPMIGKAVRRMQSKQKFEVIGWNVRSFDTTTNDIDKTINRIAKQIKPGSIILLHDRLSTTPALLNKLIPLLLQKGYQFATVR